MFGILDDVNVIELAGSLSGAYCAKLLADQGAPTIKVEPPGTGDPVRHQPPFIGSGDDNGLSSLFLAFNTNKRGITLDLTAEEGRRLLMRLVQDSDVLIEGYAPGYLD